MQEENQKEIEETIAFSSDDAQIPHNAVKFETRIKVHPNKSVEKEVWINNKLLDWSVDVSSFIEAKRMGQMYERAVKQSIAEHFVNSISDLLGRKVTIKEVHEATKRGWI